MFVYVLGTVRFNKHERFDVHKCADGAKSRALALSMRTIHRHGHSINSAEDRTPHELSSVIFMRLAARTTYSDSVVCATLTHNIVLHGRNQLRAGRNRGAQRFRVAQTAVGVYDPCRQSHENDG